MWSHYVMVACLLITSFAASTAEDNFNVTAHCGDDFNQIEPIYRCACAKAAGEDRDAMLGYLEFHYCTMEEFPVLSIVLLSIWLIFLFYVIAGTTDDFLVPALTVGVDLCHISPNVAGATILAFANGAPDLFTAIAAFSGDKQDADLGFGSILGGGMFILTLTLGTVTVVSKGFETYRRPLLRDLVAYTTAVGFLLFVYQDGKIYVSESISLICLYCAYVLVVVIGHLVYQRYMKPRKQQVELEKEKDVDSQSSSNNLAVSSYEINVLPEKEVLTPVQEGSTGVPYGPQCTPISKQSDLRSTGGSMREVEESGRRSLTQFLKLSGSRHSSEPLDIPDNGFWGQLLLFWELVTQWSEKTNLGKTLALIEFPVSLARRLTIPMVEPETWHRTFTALTMFFAPLLILFVACTPEIPVILCVAAGGICLAVFSWLRTTYTLPTATTKLMFYVVVAFVLSSFWAYIVANEIVDVMQCIGMGVGVSTGVLGVTVLAWGNSIGDYVSNMALAKSGHARMAGAECFGGPMFNLMFGGGISFLLGSLRTYPAPLRISKNDVVAGYGFIFLFSTIVLLAVTVPLCGFKFRREFGLCLIGLYLVFMVFSVLSTTGSLPALF